jgi:glutamate formiminotransferase/formiminotetrahydrofolate cyclodeaminase
VTASLIETAEKAQAHREAMLRAVDEDSEAFRGVMDAMRRPASTPEETKVREEAIREANRRATLVPLACLARVPEILDLCRRAAERGNPSSVSDAGVGGLCARAAAEGTYYNVLINLQGFAGDEAWVADTRRRAIDLVAEARRRADELARFLEGKLGRE